MEINNEILERMIKICDSVSQDVKDDAENFDGQPFNGKTVATYFGYHGAAISALSNILKELLQKFKN